MALQKILNTAGSLIPHFFPSFSRLFSFFFYCTQHAHTFPVLLVTVHGVAICAATATRRGPWRGPEFGVLFFFKYKNTEAVGTKNIYTARSFYFRLSLCPFSLSSLHTLCSLLLCVPLLLFRLLLPSLDHL